MRFPGVLLFLFLFLTSCSGADLSDSALKGATVYSAEDAWVNKIVQLDSDAKVTVQSLANPDRALGKALKEVKLDATKGCVYFPLEKTVTVSGCNKPNGKSFIPMILYSVSEAQLNKLRNSFPLNTINPVSKILGQKENRGLNSKESFAKGTRTLWRMAVYNAPKSKKETSFFVGFYGEYIPEDCKVGDCMTTVMGCKVPLRQFADARVGTEISEANRSFTSAMKKLELNDDEPQQCEVDTENPDSSTEDKNNPDVE